MKTNLKHFYIKEKDAILILVNENQFELTKAIDLYDFGHGNLFVFTNSKDNKYVPINKCLKSLNTSEVFLLSKTWNQLERKFKNIEKKLLKIKQIYLQQCYLGISLQSKLQKIEIKRNAIINDITFLRPLVSYYLNESSNEKSVCG